MHDQGISTDFSTEEVRNATKKIPGLYKMM